MSYKEHRRASSQGEVSQAGACTVSDREIGGTDFGPYGRSGEAGPTAQPNAAGRNDANPRPP
jgi:hypothetical protein